MQMRSNIIFILFHAQLSLFAIERETICSSSHLLLEQAFVWIHISWSSLLTALPRLSAGLRSVLFEMCLWLAAFSIPLWILLGDSAIYIIKYNCFSGPNGALHHTVYGSNVIGEL